MFQSEAVALFMSYISTLDSDYGLPRPIPITRRVLSDIILDTNVMTELFHPLSELVLQRKITEEDEDKAAIEVELILWEFGRNLMLEKSDSRTSG